MSQAIPNISQQLLSAALIGLLGAQASGCGKDEKKVEVSPAAPVVTSKSEDKTMTLATFTTQCTERGGLVQSHATCAGNNSCKGVSFNDGILSEHTCKGMNGCSGMSCVDLPKDAGRTGAQILEGTTDTVMGGSSAQCSYCHSPSKKADANVDTKSFKIPIKPGITVEAGVAAFKAKSDAVFVSAIAFGMHGVNANGSAYANMPAFYGNYSAVEITRLVTHIRTLPIQGVNWTDPK